MGHRQHTTCVLVIGNLSWDRLLLVDRLPLPNKDTTVLKALRFPGGAGANVACMLSLLGIPVALLSKVGEDDAGKALIDDLATYGVDTSMVIRSKDQTSELLVVMDDDGNRSFYIDTSQAAFQLDEQDLLNIGMQKHNMICVVGINWPLTEIVLSSMATQIPISLALGFLVASNSLPDNWLHSAGNSNLVFLNRSELDALTEIDRTKLLSSSILPRHGVIVTNGGNPAVFYHQSETTCMAPETDEHIVHTLGCGDAFMAGCLAAHQHCCATHTVLQVGHQCAGAVAKLITERSPNLDLTHVKEMLKND